MAEILLANRMGLTITLENKENDNSHFHGDAQEDPGIWNHVASCGTYLRYLLLEKILQIFNMLAGILGQGVLLAQNEVCFIRHPWLH